ncbi:MAG: cyclic nucleotide-binding domain-containing protein [Myxococcales bacterium]|jgi:cAMP-dependent protein kinase regulator
MAKSSQAPEQPPLERARALRIAGETQDALRLAAAAVGADASDPGAALLLARLLDEAGRDEAAAEAAPRLVDAHVRRGDLPAARLAAELGDRTAALGIIAEAFGAGSPRVQLDAAPAPPPLPRPVRLTPPLSEAQGEPLLSLCEQALSRFDEADDPVAADRPLPRLPLFGSLQATRLQRLLAAMTPRELAAGEAAVTEGEEGDAAYVVVRGALEVRRRGRGGAGGDGGDLLAVLGPGALFGEMALVSSAPRAASAVASCPTELLVMTRAALEELAAEDQALARELSSFCHGRMVANLLRHGALLSAVPAAERATLMAAFSPRTFEAGEALVRAGDEPSALHLIASGAVQVRAPDAEGERVRLAELGPGDVVGEISLVLRRPANADAVASHRTLTLSLDRDGFHAVIDRHPALLKQLYDMAVHREAETRNILGQAPVDADDMVLL